VNVKKLLLHPISDVLYASATNTTSSFIRRAHIIYESALVCPFNTPIYTQTRVNITQMHFKYYNPRQSSRIQYKQLQGCFLYITRT